MISRGNAVTRVSLWFKCSGFDLIPVDFQLFSQTEAVARLTDKPMNSAKARPRASRQTILVCLVLAMIVGIAALLQSPRAGEAQTPSSPISTGKVAVRIIEQAKQEKPAKAAPSPGPAATPSAVSSAILPGHEGHGDECAQCLAERKLVVYREDFAQLHFSRIQEEFELDASRSGEVLDACRVFARTVLTEWSFSDSKPRLPEDAALEARRQQLLGPMLANLPPKAGESL